MNLEIRRGDFFWKKIDLCGLFSLSYSFDIIVIQWRSQNIFYGLHFFNIKILY
jgi:hypothetical protein